MPCVEVKSRGQSGRSTTRNYSSVRHGLLRMKMCRCRNQCRPIGTLDAKRLHRPNLAVRTPFESLASIGMQSKRPLTNLLGHSSTTGEPLGNWLAGPHRNVLGNRPALVALALFSPLAAFSQSVPAANYTSFEATSAKPLQIGYYATARRDCAPAQPPTIRVVEPPKSGILTIKPGELTTSAVAGCPALKTSALVVYYQARAGAIGADHFVYEVVGLDGKINGYDVTITIREPPKAPISGGDKPI